MTQTDDESPHVFVRDARALLLSGRVEEAMTLLDCVRGSSAHYPTFYVVEGECLLALGMVEEARKTLRHALHLLPNSARAAMLLESTSNEPVHDGHPKIHEPASGAEFPTEIRIEPTLAILFEDIDPAFEPIQSGKTVLAMHDTPPSDGPGFNLDRVANLLSSERPLVRPTTPVSHEKSAVSPQAGGPEPFMSETLAQILLAQGKVEEALQAFKQLRAAIPNRAKYFDDRIRLIENGINE